MLDPSRFRRAPDARSLTFFCIDDMVGVDEALIDELVDVSERNGRCNARICLHRGPDADFHEMVILEHKGFYYPPHRHALKGESSHIIRGQLACFCFDDHGEVLRHSVLGRGGNVIFRVGRAQWHAVLPLTDLVVYHEAKPGPFLGANDSEFAGWAPARNHGAAIETFLAGLRRMIVASAPSQSRTP